MVAELTFLAELFQVRCFVVQNCGHHHRAYRLDRAYRLNRAQDNMLEAFLPEISASWYVHYAFRLIFLCCCVLSYHCC